MVLNIGNGFFGNDNNLITTEAPSQLGRVVKNTQIWAQNSIIDTSVSNHVMELYTSAEEKNRGFRVTITFSNQCGSDNTYDFAVTNHTKGTILNSVSVLVTDRTYRSYTYFYDLDQVTPGDVLRVTFTDGQIGTAVAPRNPLQFMEFIVESFTEEVNT